MTPAVCAAKRVPTDVANVVVANRRKSQGDLIS